MTVRFADRLVDRFIAPGVSKFTEASIPDLSSEFPEGRYWIANNFLNNVTGSSLAGDVGRYSVALLRRVQYAFVAYHDARQATIEYLASLNAHEPIYMRYFRALELWEIFTIQSSIAIDLFGKFNCGERAFDKKGPATNPTKRLYDIAMKIKHLETVGADYDKGISSSVPLWLTNQGLNSFGVLLTFDEAAEELRQLSGVADDVQDAKTFVERNKQFLAEEAAKAGSDPAQPGDA